MLLHVFHVTGKRLVKSVSRKIVGLVIFYKNFSREKSYLLPFSWDLLSNIRKCERLQRSCLQLTYVTIFGSTERLSKPTINEHESWHYIPVSYNIISYSIVLKKKLPTEMQHISFYWKLSPRFVQVVKISLPPLTFNLVYVWYTYNICNIYIWFEIDWLTKFHLFIITVNMKPKMIQLFYSNNLMMEKLYMKARITMLILKSSCRCNQCLWLLNLITNQLKRFLVVI